jgi:hypothetical protein
MDVSFDEDKNISTHRMANPVRQGGFVGMLVRGGYAKDARSASRILLGITIIGIIASIGIIVFTGKKGPSISPEEYQKQSENQPIF